ncbi:hypothetical protein C8J40_11118 [Sphingomonas sp. PP-CC-3A-396]|nr:hypothetical protein C8J40_11118 [Sphingomonas sp. PP-CC-3A-396]
MSEAIVTDAIDALSWKDLRDHFDALTLDADSAERLVGIVLRSRSLVFRYPGKVAKRAAIVAGVVAKIRADLGDENADGVARRLAVFEMIDEGYAGIRALIDGLPLAARPRTEMIAAYLAYAAKAWADLRRQIEEAPPATRVGGSVVLSTDYGDRFGADAMTSVLVGLLGMNVTLAAYQGKWFDGDDLVRLPELPIAAEADVVLAGAADGTALAWQQWQLVEERCRYLQGSLARRASTDEDGVPAGSEIFVHEPGLVEWELLDTVANERLGDRLRQTFQEMWIKTNLPTVGRGVSPGAPMPPAGYVSPQEMHSVVMLSEYLGINVATHSAELGGLRLCEWMRGFAVLQQLANDRLEAGGDEEEAAFPRFEVTDLEDMLRRNGLAGGKAGRFIDHASFAKSSRDLYDAPIIRGAGDWCLLAVPALSEALLLRLVLSTLANKRLDVVGKGEAFEEQFRTSIATQGLPVYHFEARRDGKTYEYDAVVPWSSHLFVFECKNRALSGTNPIASSNFLRSALDHIAQVQRLAAALKAHPDILVEHVPEDCSGLTIVPVVLSSMPFSIGGDIDGVYFSDAASIGRFFQERYSFTSRLHEVAGVKVLHRVATHSQWSGDEPTPEDLIRHLEKPLQFRVLLPHMEVRPIGFQIGSHLYAHTPVVRRKEMTMESMAETAGLTAEAIEAEMARVAEEAIEPLRAKLEEPPGNGDGADVEG